MYKDVYMDIYTCNGRLFSVDQLMTGPCLWVCQYVNQFEPYFMMTE